MTVDGNLAEFPQPHAASEPMGITAGPDGALWFTLGTSEVGRVLPGGSVTALALPSAGGASQGVTAGPGDTVWVTEWKANALARFDAPVPPTPTATATITATPSPTRTSTLTPTITPTAVPCGSRPPVQVTAQPTGAGRLHVTIAAGTNAGAPANQLTALQFGAGANALVDVPGQPAGQPGGFAVTLPPGTTQTTFVVRQATPGQAATLALTVVDACGSWPTLVGGGPAAFASAAGPSSVPVAAVTPAVALSATPSIVLLSTATPTR